MFSLNMVDYSLTFLLLSTGIWAEFDLLPLVTSIKYIDFRVFLAAGVIWVEAQQNSHLGN